MSNTIRWFVVIHFYNIWWLLDAPFPIGQDIEKKVIQYNVQLEMEHELAFKLYLNE